MSVEVSSETFKRSATPPTKANARRAAWLAWTLLALALLIAIPDVILATVNNPLTLADNILSAAFLLIFAGGYFYVGFASLKVLWNMNREAETEALLADAPEPAST